MDAGERFRKNLKRLTAGMTRTEASQRLGISRSHLLKYLEGSSTPGLVQAERIAQALGVTLIDMLGSKKVTSRKMTVTPRLALCVLTDFVRKSYRKSP